MKTNEKFEKWYKKETGSLPSELPSADEIFKNSPLMEHKYKAEEFITHRQELYDDSLDAYTAGHKEGEVVGRKETLKDVFKSLQGLKHIEAWKREQYQRDKALYYIDTELKKLEE